jgi:hypothetical protein
MAQDYDTGGVLPSFRGAHRHGDALRADGGPVTLALGLFMLGAHLFLVALAMEDHGPHHRRRAVELE